jgi:anion-transporting  ArsA/GET3 family ATPase
VVVVTVDPARRLADALGLDELGNDPHRVAPPAGERWSGELHAVMLDTASTFDRLVRSQAPSADRAEAILANPMYRNIAGALSGTQEYMAVEKLHQLHHDDAFDLVVVDTPPSRNAIDLLEAPGRLVRFLEHPLYRLLTAPSRAGLRVVGATARVFLRTIRRVAGGRIVEDAIEFFQAFAGMEEGFRRRAAEVDALLRAEGSGFVVVSSPRAEAVRESTHLARELRARELRIDGAIVNLVHRELPTIDPARAVPDELAPLVAVHRQLGRLAAEERQEIAPLAAAVRGTPLVEVPLLDQDVHDVEGLGRIADELTAADVAAGDER